MIALDTAIRTKLVADNGVGGVNTLTSGRIYRHVAPQSAASPFVVFQQMSAVDEYTWTLRDHRRILYQIKAVSDGLDPAAAGVIAKRIDTILTDGSLTISGGTLLYLRRTADVEYTELDGDRYFQHLGAIFDLMVGGL